MTISNDCVIVPVSEESLRIIKRKGYYIFPKGSLREVKFIYFYVTKPVSQIQYYSKVLQRVQDAEDKVSLIEKMQMFKDPSKDASALKLGKVIELKQPITQGLKLLSIQSKAYCSRSKLEKADTLDDLRT